RGRPALRPGVRDGDVVAAAPQLTDDRRVGAGLDGDAAGAHAARVEGPGEAVVVPVRGVDRALQVESAAHGRAQGDGEEEVQLPLVLLVPAGRAEGEDGPAVAQGDARAERGAGAAADR